MNDLGSQYARAPQPTRARHKRLIVLVLAVGGLAMLALLFYFGFVLFKASFYPDKPSYLSTVVVEAHYPGANARSVAEFVAVPIEQELIGIEGGIQMTSRCTDSGDLTITMTFKPGSDLNMAQVLVQNRISLALPLLPAEVNNLGVRVRKQSGGLLMYVVVASDGRLDEIYLNNLATTQVIDELAHVPGVTDVTCLGQQSFGVRVIPDPNKLAARQLTQADVMDALVCFKLRQEAGADGLTEKPLDLLSGEKSVPEELKAVLLRKADGAGQPLWLRDVAEIEIGDPQPQKRARLNGHAVAVLPVYFDAQFKPRAVATAVQDSLSTLQAAMPDGVLLKVALDFASCLEITDRPTSDYLRLDVTLPNSASIERTLAILNRCEAISMRADGVQNVLSMSGPAIGLPQNQGCVLARFSAAIKPDDKELRAKNLRARLSEEVGDAGVRICDPTRAGRLPLEGYPIDLAIYGPDDAIVRQIGEAYARRLATCSELTDVSSNAWVVPSPTFKIDIAKKGRLSIPDDDLARALQPPSTVILRNGRTWHVQVKARDVLEVRVRAGDGTLVRLGDLGEMRMEAQPVILERLNGQPMAEVTANLAPDATPAAARALCEKVLSEVIPAGTPRSSEYRMTWLHDLPRR